MAVFQIWSDEGNTADNARLIDRFAYTGYANKSEDVDWLKLDLTPGTYQISVLPDLAEVTYDPAFAFVFGTPPGAPVLWQETVVGATLYEKIISSTGVGYSSVGAFLQKDDDLAVSGRTLSTGNRIQFEQGTFQIKSPSVSGDVRFTGEYFLKVTASPVALLNDGLADINTSGKFSNNAGRYLITLGNPTGQRQEYWGGNWIDSNNFMSTNSNTDAPKEFIVEPSKLPSAAQWKTDSTQAPSGRATTTSPEYHFDPVTGRWFAPGGVDITQYLNEAKSAVIPHLKDELESAILHNLKEISRSAAPNIVAYLENINSKLKEQEDVHEAFGNYQSGKLDFLQDGFNAITPNANSNNNFDGEVFGRTLDRHDQDFFKWVAKQLPQNSVSNTVWKAFSIVAQHSDVTLSTTFDISGRPQVYTAPAGHQISFLGSDGIDIVSGGDGGAFVFGGGGNDQIFGGLKSDVILGGPGDDQIDGRGGDDRIWGNDGNDQMVGGAGNDLLVGGSGIDTAIYSGIASSYVVKSYVDSGSKFSWQITDRVSGRDGQDKLQSVEKLQFADGSLSLEAPAKASLFGTMLYSASGLGGEVYSLYDGILGRAPDLLGFQAWTDLLNHGADIKSLASAFFGSPEGQARANALNNAAFVEQLYTANLHRSSDPGGLQWWVDNLNQGASRGDVAASFALSAEHMENLAGTFSGGVFVPDLNATSVARLYYAVLNRSPDAGGLTYWTNQVKNGASLDNVTQSFLTAPEVVSKTGNLSSSQYVDFIYINALGRHAEPGGLTYWTDLLNQGQSRVGVTTTIGLSTEAQQRHLTQIESEWQLA